MIWQICDIQPHIDDVKALFAKNHDHKHADNYSRWPLFNFTKFSRMAWADGKMIYYSAGIERPEYMGSIRIMSRHTRDRDYDFGGWRADLTRGLATLDASAHMAMDMGYTNIWVSREENPKLLEYFAQASEFDWDIVHEDLPGNVGKQWVLRKKYC
jgi:hypothetical protein